MTHSPDEKRAYGRGYNAGCRAIAEVQAEANRRITDLAASLAAATAGRMGPCEDCQHWTRGCATCHWGECGVARGALGGEIWMRAAEGSMDGVTTSEKFGCVLWAPAAKCGSR